MAARYNKLCNILNARTVHKCDLSINKAVYKSAGVLLIISMPNIVHIYGVK